MSRLRSVAALTFACHAPPSGRDTDAADTDLQDACADPGSAPVGVICTIAGFPGVSAYGAEDVPAVQSELYLPLRVVVAPDGALIVIDFMSHRLRRIDADGVIHTIAGTGFLGDGPPGDALAASFNQPTGAFVFG